jgi:hypothetical protein
LSSFSSLAGTAKGVPRTLIVAELSMNASEVHAAVQRAVASRLLQGPEMGHRPKRTAMDEFLITASSMPSRQNEANRLATFPLPTQRRH